MFQGPTLRDKLALPDDIKKAVEMRNWGQVDRLCSGLALQGGNLFETLRPLAGQKRIEFIINVRDARNPWEEDGIWHDDGSRIMAFTMGLNLRPETITGGNLLIRRKGDKDALSFSPPGFGELIVFRTGVDGYEHKVQAVVEGLRVVMAGWCYSD